jgi:hypothetical protein
MSVFRVNKKDGLEPIHWTTEKFSNIDYEEWMKHIFDLRPIVDAGTIYGEQREKVKDAIGDIVFEGLMPAYLDLKEIRMLGTSDKPILDQWQSYEGLARKLWKAYKELMQNAIRLMDFNIGFLFDDDKKFRKGLIEFRQNNPTLHAKFEKLLEMTRAGWQSDLYKFRNSLLEHHGGDRKDFEWFYKPENAESLFQAVWKTIANVLPMLLELRLMHGMRLMEQRPDDPGPRWNQRFMYYVPGTRFP